MQQDFFERFLEAAPRDAVLMLMRDFARKMSGGPPREDFCNGLRRSITVFPDGSLAPCLSFRKFSIGNIVADQRSLRQILDSSAAYGELLALQKNALKCRDCELFRYCLVCPGAMLVQDGAYTRPPQQTCNFGFAIAIFMNAIKTSSRFPEAAEYFFFEQHGLCARAAGNSMAPFIRDGQSVPISREIGPLRPGTCYFFFNENRFILHRLVRVNKKGALFMGDNSDTAENRRAGNHRGAAGQAPECIGRDSYYSDKSWILYYKRPCAPAHDARDPQTAYQDNLFFKPGPGMIKKIYIKPQILSQNINMHPLLACCISSSTLTSYTYSRLQPTTATDSCAAAVTKHREANIPTIPPPTASATAITALAPPTAVNYTTIAVHTDATFLHNHLVAKPPWLAKRGAIFFVFSSDRKAACPG